MAMLMSFLARALSSIPGDYFCYIAISSAAIVGILPGYLVRMCILFSYAKLFLKCGPVTSSLELASKNIVCGSIKMVYSLIYTTFLAFGLQIGSDVYLRIDGAARQRLEGLANRLFTSVSVEGTFNATDTSSRNAFLNGTFTVTYQSPQEDLYIHEGCYRFPNRQWYLQPFPWWTQFFLVPLFSLFSSLSNMQPILSIQLIVMVIISCAAYAANKAANMYIFRRSDVVSMLGAFTVGILGNAYSRKMGGTAFTSMVTGVLFLVPSGLSQTGALSGGNGIAIGGAMIAVSIGITVGLFISQAFVYMFGSRKGAAMFSF